MTNVLIHYFRQSPQNLLGLEWMEVFNEINIILEIIKSDVKNSPKEKVEGKLQILRTYLINQPEIANIFGLKKPLYSRSKSAKAYLMH